MNTVRSFDGTPIAYEQTGAGRPLVLIHGATADRSRWLPVLPALSESYAVYTVDRRGRGGSGDGEPYSIEREFEDIAALVDSLDEPAHLLGHSFGALCALNAALLTRNLRSLILYEPPPPGLPTLPAAITGRLQALLDAGDRDGLVAAFMLEVAKVPAEQLAVMRAAPSWAGRVAAAHTILREGRAIESLPPFDAARYRGIAAPVLLLLGGDSPALYRDSIEAIHSALPDSRLVILPGQQHIAINTAPDLFAREVLTFLRETS
jgi:pimeloyl-ACP methyl ester carboxylesterase